MKRIFYLCQLLVILQILNPSSVFGQESVYSNEKSNLIIKSELQNTPLNISHHKAIPVLLEHKAYTLNPYIIISIDHITIGPTTLDTTSILISSNIKWKIINSVGWIKTDPDAYLSTDGDKRVKISPNTQWLTLEDITGVDMQGVFTIEEDSPSPSRIIKTISVTFKSYPGVLITPVHSITFNSITSKTYSITSNLPWTAEPKTITNWLTIIPSYSVAGTVNLKMDCKSTNAGSKDNSVYLILKQSKGVVKDSILIVQQGSSVGIEEYEKSGFKLYPQPAGETLNIDLPSTNELKYWEIYNPSGIELLSGRIGNKTNLQIPVTQLTPGIYFITLRSDSQKIGLKFTK
jgi:hypothetical protein